jgi:integrase
VSDVHPNGDRWAFHIEECDDEDTAKSLKNTASQRVVPMHKTLDSAGFLQSVDERRRAKDQRLFPGLKPVKGKLGATPSRAWRDYLTRIGVKHGADGYGLHSFRHTITDQLRLAGYYDDQIAVVLGHSKDLMTTHYGKMAEGTFQQRCEIIDSVAFTGVDFSKILPAAGH